MGLSILFSSVLTVLYDSNEVFCRGYILVLRNNNYRRKQVGASWTLHPSTYWGKIDAEDMPYHPRDQELNRVSSLGLHSYAIAGQILNSLRVGSLAVTVRRVKLSDGFPMKYCDLSAVPTQALEKYY